MEKKYQKMWRVKWKSENNREKPKTERFFFSLPLLYNVVLEFAYVLPPVSTIIFSRFWPGISSFSSEKHGEEFIFVFLPACSTIFPLSLSYFVIVFVWTILFYLNLHLFTIFISFECHPTKQNVLLSLSLACYRVWRNERKSIENENRTEFRDFSFIFSIFREQQKRLTEKQINYLKIQFDFLPFGMTFRKRIFIKFYECREHRPFKIFITIVLCCLFLYIFFAALPISLFVDFFPLLCVCLCKKYELDSSP